MLWRGFVCPSVHQSVSPSVRRSVTQCANALRGDLTCITTPAYLYATDVVYTALFLYENVFLYPRILDPCWSNKCICETGAQKFNRKTGQWVDQQSPVTHDSYVISILSINLIQQFSIKFIGPFFTLLFWGTHYIWIKELRKRVNETNKIRAKAKIIPSRSRALNGQQSPCPAQLVCPVFLARTYNTVFSRPTWPRHRYKVKTYFRHMTSFCNVSNWLDNTTQHLSKKLLSR